jgi:hypothetical protein
MIFKIHFVSHERAFFFILAQKNRPAMSRHKRSARSNRRPSYRALVNSGPLFQWLPNETLFHMIEAFVNSAKAFWALSLTCKRMRAICAALAASKRVEFTVVHREPFTMITSTVVYKDCNRIYSLLPNGKHAGPTLILDSVGQLVGKEYYGNLDETTCSETLRGELLRERSYTQNGAHVRETYDTNGHLWLRTITYGYRARIQQFCAQEGSLVCDETKLSGDLHGRSMAWWSHDRGHGMRTSGKHRAGYRRGLWLSWHANGQLAKRKWYDDKGQEHGKHVTWYEDGRLKEISRFRHGCQHGLCIQYDEQGKRTSTTYVEGFYLPGTHILSHRDGVLRLREKYTASMSPKKVDTEPTHERTPGGEIIVLDELPDDPSEEPIDVDPFVSVFVRAFDIRQHKITGITLSAMTEIDSIVGYGSGPNPSVTFALQR